MDLAPAPQLRLSLIGGFCLRFGEDELDLTRPAQRLLVHLAVVHRRAKVSRVTLAERLWADAEPARATASLRTVLWRLPRPRGRMLVQCTSTAVRLSDDVVVDLWEAEEAAQELREGLRPGVAQARLWREDLLPGWRDEWLDVERESYRQLRLHALERSSEVLRVDGRHEEALGAALEAVRSEPLRESAHRRVVEVHLAEGNHAEALRQYDHYRRLLADELGLSPSPVIRRLVGPMLGRPLDSA
ncbi:transcriptional regulator [Nocardioides sp. IC4_145]|uniref:AfsR/SARP family transcriptional regulator n=1 Tax=Nocardioides sp. IC4_145 TaxID=2714037 RepID=UPI00140CF71D|nr:BTAD domain-containing putative transcriptional regulator [Nocardioides sp. IC4_145]NHC23145.1 transcriptional regulator [Nocardioides sp. IC4_145]